MYVETHTLNTHMNVQTKSHTLRYIHVDIYVLMYIHTC